MADTIDDIEVSNSSFADVEDLTGISGGTAITIQNKSTSPLLLVVGATQPLDSFKEGRIIPPLEEFDLKVGNSKAWLKSLVFDNAVIHIEET